MELSELMTQIKQLIITECEKTELNAGDISDVEVLFGESTQVDLDSLDALQLAVAIKKRYGVRIEGGVESREAFINVRSLAEYILGHQSM
jgi:acyl carrier protein